MKTILFIAPYFPYPQDEGGKIRVFNIIKNLSKKGFTIDFVSLVYDEKEFEYKKYLEKYCRTIQTVLHNPPPRSNNIFSKIVRALFHKPDLITKRYNKKMDEIVQKLYSENDYDIIHVAQLYCYQYVRNFDHQKIILSEHNIESEIFKRYINTKDVTKDLQISKWKLRNHLEISKLNEYEINVWKKVNGIITVSKRDKNYIQNKINKKEIKSISNGVDLEFFNNKYIINNNNPEEKFNEFKDDFKLVYTGSFTHYPNTDAIMYFYYHAFEKLKELIPNIRLFVVGKNPYPDLISLNQDKNVMVTGYVKDVRPYIYNSDLFIVPLRIGGGSRLKILQAMGMQKCVLSTEVGAEGIECEHNKNIILVDKADEMIDAVKMLYDNRNKINDIGKNAFKLVKNEYSWETIVEQLSKYYDNLID